jgi:hypothetical protein
MRLKIQPMATHSNPTLSDDTQEKSLFLFVDGCLLADDARAYGRRSIDYGKGAGCIQPRGPGGLLLKREIEV